MINTKEEEGRLDGMDIPARQRNAVVAKEVPQPALPKEPVPVGLVSSPKAAEAMAMLKSTAPKVWKELSGLPQTSDFIRAVKNWVANKGLASLGIIKMRKEIDGIWKNLEIGGRKLTDKQIRIRAAGVTNYIQANGDRALLMQRAAATKNLELRQGYEAGANLTPEETAIADKVRQTFKDYIPKLKAAGIDVTEFENYVTQMWQARLAEKAGIGVPRTLSDYFKFKSQRFFQNYFEGEQAGYKPQTKDIREILATYMHAADTSINNRKLVAELMQGKASDGHPILMNTGGGVHIPAKRDPATGAIINDPADSRISQCQTKGCAGRSQLQGTRFPGIAKVEIRGAGFRRNACPVSR